MAIAEPPVKTKTLTWEAYLFEETVVGRNDIIDGERIYMSAPTTSHQRCLMNIAYSFETFSRRTRQGVTLPAPLDIVISRYPLRTRQPDVLIISKARYGLIEDLEKPLEVAPELVVEILSESNSRRHIESKMDDYCRIGVNECWLVNTNARTVEVFQLTVEGPVHMHSYTEVETVKSLRFADREVPVDDIFAPAI